MVGATNTVVDVCEANDPRSHLAIAQYPLSMGLLYSKIAGVIQKVIHNRRGHV